MTQLYKIAPKESIKVCKSIKNATGRAGECKSHPSHAFRSVCRQDNLIERRNFGYDEA